MRTNVALILGATVMLALAGAVQADVSSPRAMYVSTDPGVELTVYSPFVPSGDTFDVGVVNLMVNLPEGQPAFAMKGFCIDLKQNASDTWKLYNLEPLEAAPRDGGSTYQNMGFSKANAIRDLWNDQFDNIGTDANLGAAFQVALWEIIYEDGQNGWDLLSGDLSISDSTVAAIATSWLSALDGLDIAGELTALTNDDGENRWQDYIYNRADEKYIPEPITVISLTMGLSGLGMYVRKRTVA